MRRFIFVLLLFAGLSPAFSQKNIQRSNQEVHRCATEDAIAERYRTDLMYRSMIDQREREFRQWREMHPEGAPAPASLLTTPVTIPVVVHVVLPNPNVITEADVEYFINRLNLDFSGLNPDSTNGVNWYGVRGHSLIRFCLAKRDPSGNFTSGIDRRVGTATIGSGEPQPIKSFSSGGLDPWNTSQYYNIWVGAASGGLLGIAPEIGVGTSLNDGVCINWQGFANNPCYTIGAFNLGRTGVHEIGHNFGLWHTFQGGCANSDMQNLTSPGCSLPAPILSLPDDTPGQSASTSGCPSGNAASGCAGSPNPPGKQYQNYMDYTDDACYSMFTNTQVQRMHWLLENCRAGYLTSQGCQLPASIVPLDAAVVETVSPGGSDFVGCSAVTYNISNCTGVFSPKVRIQNRGSTTLTSVTVQLTLNGTPLPAQTFAVSLAYGKSAVVTLNDATLIAGNNTISYTVSAPNGGADGNASNNTVNGNYNFVLPASTALPLTEDFVATTFPPAGKFTILNPNGNNTWVRNGNGNGNAGSAFIDNYNFNLTGQVDELRTVLLNIPAGADSITLDFDLAFKNFPGLNDRLQVLVSSDCGATFTSSGTNPVFDRAGATLATAGSSTANYTTPAAADWKRQHVGIYVGCGSPFATGGTLIITFRATNGYGNNIFLDNISIGSKSPFLPPTVTQPDCPGALGAITINTTGGPYDFSINGGTSWQASNVFLNLAPGNYNLAIRPTATPSCVINYSGNPVTINAAPVALTLPQTQDFSGATFPPLNMTVVNPNGNVTWVRNNNGNGGVGAASIDNYNFNLVGQTDDLRTKGITRGTINFVNVSFDLAHKNFPGLNDRLQLLYSTDCGATFTGTGFDFSGAALATAGSSTAAYTTPAAADWVRKSVDINLCGVSGSNLMFAFRSTNGYGNNIFIDNIDIKADPIVTGVSVVQPTCTAPNGSITITASAAGGAKEYSVNNGGTWQSSNVFTGLTPGSYTVLARLTATPSCTYAYASNPVILNALPVLNVNQPANQVVCNGSATASVTFAGSAEPGTTYNWTNNTTSIGLGASGTNTIPSFNATNTGTTPVVATITVTPNAGACTGPSKTFTITVNPTPNAVATPSSQTICSGTAIGTIALTGNVSGTTFNWTRNNTATVTGIGASGSGNISGTLTNTTAAPVTVTFTITPTANGCPGTPITATVTVNPLPTITCPANITTPSTVGACTAVVNYTPTITGTPAPTTSYVFTGATTGSGSGTGSGSTFNLGTTTVTITATNSCATVTCSFTITVTDSQLPVITAQPANRTVCEGVNATFTVAATNALSYTWQVWNGTTWNNIAGQTTATLTLTNLNNSNNATSYRVLVNGLCTQVTSTHATLFVNPLPVVSLVSSPTPALVTPVQTVDLVAQIQTPGGTFAWFKNGTAIPGSASAGLSDLGVNDVGTYRFVYTSPAGCVATSNNVDVTAAASSNLFVYPNPNNGHFRVRYFNGNNEQLTISVFDSKGARVYQRAFTAAIPYAELSIDLPTMHAEGLYTVEVRNASGEKVGSKALLVKTR